MCCKRKRSDNAHLRAQKARGAGELETAALHWLENDGQRQTRRNIALLRVDGGVARMAAAAAVRAHRCCHRRRRFDAPPLAFARGHGQTNVVIGLAAAYTVATLRSRAMVTLGHCLRCRRTTVSLLARTERAKSQKETNHRKRRIPPKRFCAVKFCAFALVIQTLSSPHVHPRFIQC